MQILIDYEGCTYKSIIMPHIEANGILDGLRNDASSLEIMLESGTLFFISSSAIKLATFRFVPQGVK